MVLVGRVYGFSFFSFLWSTYLWFYKCELWQQKLPSVLCVYLSVPTVNKWRIVWAFLLTSEGHRVTGIHCYLLFIHLLMLIFLFILRTWGHWSLLIALQHCGPWSNNAGPYDLIKGLSSGKLWRFLNSFSWLWLKRVPSTRSSMWHVRIRRNGFSNWSRSWNPLPIWRARAD